MITAQSLRKFQKGFTLIELLVVISVIAVLAAITLFGLSRIQSQARDTQRFQLMSSIATSLERYYSDNQAYPAAGTAWGNGAGTLFSNNTTPPLLGAYLTTVMTDPGCGAANAANAAARDIRALAAAGTLTGTAGCVAAGPIYAYTFGAGPAGSNCTNLNGYTLTLTKESGGVKFWCSPQ